MSSSAGQMEKFSPLFYSTNSTNAAKLPRRPDTGRLARDQLAEAYSIKNTKRVVQKDGEICQFDKVPRVVLALGRGAGWRGISIWE